MTATDIDRLQTSMVTMIQKLTDKIEVSDQRAVKFQDELQVSVRSLFTAEAEVQRAAITEQFRVQGDRVTHLEATLASMMVSMKAIQGEQDEDEPLVLKMLEYENVPDVEPEDMMEQALQASLRRNTFFELPENKGKHDKYQKDLRHLHAMESWKGKEDFRDWLMAAVAWVGHADLAVMDHTEVKFACGEEYPKRKGG